MASAYPGGLDSLATNKANATVTATDHPTHHNDLADAVNKIEAELGINPSGSESTVTARLGVLGGRYSWPSIAPTLTGAYDDPFTSDSSAAWTETTPVSGSVDWNFTTDGLVATSTNIAAYDTACLLKAADIDIGDYIETYLPPPWTNHAGRQLAGLCFTDGTTGASNITYMGLGQDGNGLTTFDQGDGTINEIGFDVHSYVPVFNRNTWIRWIYSAANTWGAYFSRDGVNYSKYGGDTGLVMTPTHLGLVVSSFSGAAVSYAKFAHFKSNAAP